MVSLFIIVCAILLFSKSSYDSSERKYQEYFEEYYTDDYED